MRGLLISVAVAVGVVAGAGCTRSNEPADPTGGPERPASGVAADAELHGALVAAGVDTDRTPDRLGELEDWMFCGSDTRTHDPAELSRAARCFLDLHIAELDAVYVSTHPTIEGDPVTTVHVTGRDGEVAMFTDSTRDAFGSGQWSRNDARRLAVPSSSGLHRIDLAEPVLVEVDVDATLPETADGDAPDWFLDRPALEWCGMDVRTSDQNLEARQCFKAAVERGVPAEYVVGQTGDEGERGIYWFRSLGPGDVEVIERTLPGSGPAAGGPPAWRRLRCDRVIYDAEPGAETYLVPMTDDPGSCREQ